MKKITIGDPQSGLFADVLPDYGGMMTRLSYKGIDILYFDEGKVHTANVLAGGCPVLFPFASRTAGDSYTLNGKKYSMPFHGLVKCASFGVEDISQNSVSLFITNNEASKKENYPFDFRLVVTYRLEGDTAEFIAEVHNESDMPMPHYFGWHHYFMAKDKKAFRVNANMRKYIDYTDGKTYDNHNDQNLMIRTDYVLFDKTDNETEIISPGDGYRALIHTDEAFEVLVVCTYFDRTVTVEPWLGLPDSIHLNRYVQWIDPGEVKRYGLRIKLSLIEA